MSSAEASKNSLDKTNNDAVQQHPDLTEETLEGIRIQEDHLVFSTLSNEELIGIGQDIISTVQALSKDKKKPVVVDIEVNGRCIYRYAMSGTAKDNDWWIERKKKTVKHFERSSYYIGRALHQSGKSWNTKYAGLPESEYAAHGGCFPIRTSVNSPVVGTITMSGLAQVLDHTILTQVLMNRLHHIDE